MKVEVVDNSQNEPWLSPGRYWRITWTSDDPSDWRAMVCPASDPRLQRYLKAVEYLKYEMGVDPELLALSSDELT